MIKKLFCLILAVGFGLAIASSALAATNDAAGAAQLQSQLAQLAAMQKTLAQLQEQAAMQKTLDQLQVVLNDIQAKIQSRQITSANAAAVSATLALINDNLTQMNLALDSSIGKSVAQAAPAARAPVAHAPYEPIVKIQPSAPEAQSPVAPVAIREEQSAVENSQAALAEETASSLPSFNKGKVLKIAFGVIGAAILLVVAWLLWSNRRELMAYSDSKSQSGDAAVPSVSPPARIATENKATNWQPAAEWKVKQGKSA